MRLWNKRQTERAARVTLAVFLLVAWVSDGGAVVCSSLTEDGHAIEIGLAGLCPHSAGRPADGHDGRNESVAQHVECAQDGEECGPCVDTWVSLKSRVRRNITSDDLGDRHVNLPGAPMLTFLVAAAPPGADLSGKATHVDRRVLMLRTVVILS